MDLKKFLKDHWKEPALITVVSALIYAVYTIGSYSTKIEYMSEKIENNSNALEKVKDNVSFLLGIIQKKNPGINVAEYTKTSMQHNLSTEAAVNGLSILKTFSPETGKLYLQRQGFTKEQASAVYSPPKTSKLNNGQPK